MPELFLNYALGFAVVYALCGMVYAVIFQIRRMEKIDPAAGKGTWGFRVLVMPGLVALWPLFFFSHRFREASALSLRRSHRIAILGLAILSAVLFVAALAWRLTDFENLPVTDIPSP